MSISLGGCTSFLQPLDTSVNKYWKEAISKRYHLWLDSKQDSLLKDQQEGSNIVMNKAGTLKSPDHSEIRDWFCTSLADIPPQRIINGFYSCGITFGITDTVSINKQLRENWQTLLESLEKDKIAFEAYLDEVEKQIRNTLGQEDEIISKDEIEDEGIKENEQGCE